MSLNRQVGKDTTPIFLWQTATDDAVPVENSCLMAEALMKEGIPFAHHIFSKGPHGLSLADETWAGREYGEPYTTEQIEYVKKAVEHGQIFEEEKEKAIKEQITFMDHADLSEFVSEPIEEVAVWPKLADTWLKDILS